MSNDKLCRACMAAKESFTYFLNENVFPEIYWYCTSIKITQDEKLPRALCNVCYNLLLKFFDFKQTCIQSQNKLLSFYSTPEIKTNDETNNISNTDLEASLVDNFDHTNDNSDSNLPDAEETLINDPVNELPCPIFIDSKEDQQIPDLQCKTIQPTQPVVNQKKKIQKRLKRELKENGITQTKTKAKKTKIYFSCDLCDKRFHSTNSYEVHKLTHDSKEPSIRCSACTKTFMTPSGLRRHYMCNHTKVNLKHLKCKICGKISKSKETLTMHLKTHEERQVFVCHVCGKSCSTAYTLKTHLETHKENRERPFTCEQCEKKFFTKIMLNAHISKRHMGRRFICNICNYPFTDKSNLAKHLLKHEQKKIHKCGICFKSYGEKSTLVEHKRIHSGERPFSCIYCPKTFAAKKRLKDHHRVHTGEKPYKCSLCKQAFTQCGTLNRHMKVHDRNIPVPVTT
ncbi:uncharacterized protein [Epargyreus clarus]|uniref:uncharacterized protein n=1 Tax=Epargyreus clarus TaxID=520877 RepID=UPI003C2F0DA4